MILIWCSNRTANTMSRSKSFENINPFYIVLSLTRIHKLVEQKIHFDEFFLVTFELFIFDEFHRVDCCVNSLQFFVKVHLSYSPTCFFESQKVDAAIHVSIHGP